MGTGGLNAAVAANGDGVFMLTVSARAVWVKSADTIWYLATISWFGDASGGPTGSLQAANPKMSIVQEINRADLFITTFPFYQNFL